MVLDASITFAFYHQDEVTPLIEAVMRDAAIQGSWAPLFWKIEIANILQVQVRKNRYGPDERDRILRDIAKLNVVIDMESPNYLWTTTIDLAHRHRLSVYDAIYLELAIRLKLPLATLDNDLRHAAEREGVPLLGL
jgi:predicted nucleic acid-binding protein